MLPDTTQARVIKYQLTKSGTSMYANFRAAMRGRSKAEFYSKLCISVEEADETEMWHDLLIESPILDNEYIATLHDEALQLVKILATMRSRLELEYNYTPFSISLNLIRTFQSIKRNFHPHFCI